ncbi:MAG: hypothetical protein EON54_00815 [Alcaligenaceae bacterium]|nr:MAG: hypothetical protein EON54_00815 [Alcaligenaceae bacterium]
MPQLDLLAPFGACALLVTTLERARDMAGKPVRVLAAHQGGNARWGSATKGTHTMSVREYGWGNSEQLARDLHADAGVSPADVDFKQIYDHFTPAVLMSLENYGLCGRGEVHHPSTPALRDYVPYNVAVVAFPDLGDIRIVSNLIEVAREDIPIGMPLRLVWQDQPPGRVLPMFVRSEEV